MKVHRLRKVTTVQSYRNRTSEAKGTDGIRCQKPLKHINQRISRKNVDLRSIFEPSPTPLKDLWENPREGKMKRNHPHD